uniref:Uncharacterized protein n=1 Tax=Candidatus Kentrum sp. SD TaxID=2126332 RepID=A0A450YSX2_9GAMM|nr:MAG: hypothetical protein BECKSD772F_GA0070984_103317 [Candidatus Kentron sp. SD]VFK44638.1 MAG: hypothetical protein BECKSD772E_GA0070983_104114 [Candidatus Kentron sp. SD]VFK79486.1 MAG: hypothetical protein BECKSD772D_GA0070982_105120 [Candidatus Kentron sp. SD]
MYRKKSWGGSARVPEPVPLSVRARSANMFMYRKKILNRCSRKEHPVWNLLLRADQ